MQGAVTHKNAKIKNELQGLVQIQTVGIQLRYSPGNYPRLSGRSGAESRNPEKAFQLQDYHIRRNDDMVDIRWVI
jgi:hypothetical protein